jgi:aspartyl-tRNA(Asn)/glutamyl-tRNA(Gln) amidotransferase subunit A
MRRIETVRRALEAGKLSSRALVDACLDEATSSTGEGARVFVHLFADSARAEADAVDRRRKAGVWTGPLGGIPISVKDLFDIRGLPTTAGSVVLSDAEPASADAVIVDRLRAAGAVIVGRTNMTEFAFSGLGLNPHYGTPANPFDRKLRRIPGGSSSGAAISVTDGMAIGAIGTDTGGSVRIPAALCGLVGFKPTARRIPQRGTLPLSTSLDSIGPLAASVRCCRILEAVLSGETSDTYSATSVDGLRLAVPTTKALDDVDPHVARTFELALDKLKKAGARITDIAVPEFSEIIDAASTATFPAAEAFAWHRELLSRARDRYDPRVSVRIAKGAAISAADYLWLLKKREELIRSIRNRTEGLDALVMPTVPLIAPAIADVDADEDRYHASNLLMLRNPTFVNFLDGCALSIPCHEASAAPVGLMLARFDHEDRKLLAVGEAVEEALPGAADRIPLAH